ncbi:unnamed protein product [Spirodela intermedia]|uniref:Uncharacterized protein n=1 Tax=Spirodela intermedia TaxID=51605 RepID=A0A7I8IID1_SPIIN|nr:unnamed protein product [Spirodela intermedia]CAA6657250.1 unnamed protein product [Spirodela intermedia]
MAARGVSCLLRRTLAPVSFRSPLNSRGIGTDLVSAHTAKWMQDTSKKSPMELINEVPPSKSKAALFPALEISMPASATHIEFICLDSSEPAYASTVDSATPGSHH